MSLSGKDRVQKGGGYLNGEVLPGKNISQDLVTATDRVNNKSQYLELDQKNISDQPRDLRSRSSALASSGTLSRPRP